MTASFRVLSLAAGAALAAFGILACDAAAGPCACTEVFRYYTVTVLDDASQAVSDATITRTNLRTGEVLESGWLGLLEPGTYVVADDGMLDAFSSEGDTVRVVGEKAGATFEAQFVFAVPDPCRCHVEKLAGPDTLIVGETLP